MMSADQFERELNFTTAIIIAKRMLKENIITKEDFNKLWRIFVQKYHPVIGSL
jgi:hypothetical protein